MAFTDRITAADLPKMPTEYQDLLRRVLTIQADAEIAGPNVYTERWLLHAPTADAMYRLARIVAEEIDHYRKFAALLAPPPPPPPPPPPRPALPRGLPLPPSPYLGRRRRLLRPHRPRRPLPARRVP